MKRNPIVLLALLVLMLSVPRPASAYIGPGSGITAIGAALAFIVGILLAIVGFIWYPLKRLLHSKATRRAKAVNAPDGSPTR
jgi:hypothetical protein